MIFSLFLLKKQFKMVELTERIILDPYIKSLLVDIISFSYEKTFKLYF
jgi:hypothetical protein